MPHSRLKRIWRVNPHLMLCSRIFLRF